MHNLCFEFLLVITRETEHNAYVKFSGGKTRCFMWNAQIVNKINFWWNDLRVSTCFGSIGKKIIFTSRKCVEEWKLAIYHLHGQTIHFMVYNFTQKSHLSFAQRSPSYWKMTTKAWNRNQRWVWRSVTQIFMWNILGQTTSCCLQSFFLLKQPTKLYSIWGNSQSCWMLLVRKAHKIPLRKLDYSTPFFILSLPFLMLLFLCNKTWTEYHAMLNAEIVHSTLTLSH